MRFYHTAKIQITFFALTATAFIAYPATVHCQDIQLNEEEQLDFANGLYERQIFDLALDEYNKYLQYFPEGQFAADAYFGRAECLFFSEQYEPAGQAYQIFIERYPDNARVNTVHLRMGQALVNTKKYPDALANLNKVDADKLSESLKPEFYFYIALTQKEEGATQKALNNFSESLKYTKNPFQAQIFMLLGDIHFEDKQYEQAVNHFEKACAAASDTEIKSLCRYRQGESFFATEDYGKSSAIFAEVLSGFPKHPVAQDSFVNLILSLFNEKRFDQVLKTFLENETRFTKKIEIIPALLTVADVQLEKGQFTEAVQSLDRTLTLEGIDQNTTKEILLKKADVYLRAKQFDELHKLIQEKLKTDGYVNAKLLFMEAEAYFGRKKFEKSAVVYEQLIAGYPDSKYLDEALYATGFAKKELGKQKEAREAFLRYFTRGKGQDKKRQALYHAVLIAYQIGDFRAGAKDAENFIKTFPGDEHFEKVLYLRGNMYQQINEYQKAVETFDQYIQQFTQSTQIVEVRFLKAYNQQLAGLVDEALASYEDILATDSTSPFFYASLKNSALLYIEKDQAAKAAEIFDRIITESQNHDLTFSSYLWLAQHYFDQGRWEDVLRILNNPQQGYTNGDTAKKGPYLKAEAFRNLKRWEEALGQYDLVLTNKDSIYHGFSLIGKALMQMELKDFDPARQNLKLAIQENSQNHKIAMKARFTMGELESQTQNLNEAVKYFMLVAVLYNDKHYSPLALWQAGKIYESLNETNRALQTYKEIIEKYKKSPYAAQAAEKVKNFNAE